MNGFVVLDKDGGLTSFQATSHVKRIFAQKKAGHTGTLDPMATGVLPVALGRAARFIDFLPDADKSYLARLRFGVTTDTLDITGKVLSQKNADVSKEQVRAALPAFRGEIMQVPPMYSAVSVGGQRLYALARRGIEVERQARPVTVYELELTNVYENGEFELSVRCSKGTYIRSLIADLGETLGAGAVMTALRRTAANGFTIENAFTEEALRADPAAALLPFDLPFGAYEALTVTEKQAFRFANGGALAADRLKEELLPGRYRVYSPAGVFLGLGEFHAGPESGLRVLRVTGDV
ncbi:MAG: tRNA pseudouridine(55) synthase TruB [Clostridia bacterium]|nr:tRNA pseudouridine(55) synthase TruB [Clostridia bacterium]